MYNLAPVPVILEAVKLGNTVTRTVRKAACRKVE
jgi:hypothetical protein